MKRARGLAVSTTVLPVQAFSSTPPACWAFDVHTLSETTTKRAARELMDRTNCMADLQIEVDYEMWH